MKGRVRTAIQPESTGLELARGSRGVTTPVPCVYLPVSLTAPGSSGSAEPARLCRGCSRPHRRPPARTSSSFTPPLRRQRDRGLPPPSGTPAPRGALRLPSAPPSCCDRTGSKGLSPPLEPQRLTAHARRAAQLRHTWRDAKIDWKALSQRIGHADVAFTMQQYVQTDLEADRQVANTLAELIIGGSLASTPVASLANPLANHMQKAPSLFEKGPLALVAGAGFEPATSGL